MRAIVLFGKEDVRLQNIPSVVLKPGEVRVRIETALTCGTDLKVFKRGYHAKMIVPPSVFGHELSGRISEITKISGEWNVGDSVVVANSAPCGECFFCRQGQDNLCDDLLFINGAYAEEIVVPARLVQKNMLRLQPDTGFKDAALTEPLACVAQGIHDLNLTGSERILILGAGPIGLMFARLTRHLGCDVTMAGRGESRLTMAGQFGARILNCDLETDLIQQVKSVGKEFDVVIEAVGKPQTWEAAINLVRKGGSINFFGGCPTGTVVRFDTARIHYSNLKLLASFHHTPKMIRRALDFIEQGIISARDFVDGECRLGELPKLFQSMAAGNKRIKTAVLVNQ